MSGAVNAASFNVRKLISEATLGSHSNTVQSCFPYIKELVSTFAFFPFSTGDSDFMQRCTSARTMTFVLHSVEGIV